VAKVGGEWTQTSHNWSARVARQSQAAVASGFRLSPAARATPAHDRTVWLVGATLAAMANSWQARWHPRTGSMVRMKAAHAARRRR